MPCGRKRIPVLEGETGGLGFGSVCTLSGGGCQMIVHIMVAEGELAVLAKGKTLTVGKSVYAHLIDCVDLEVLAISADVSAYIDCMTDSYTAMLLKNAHPIPPTLVFRIHKQPLDLLAPEGLERMRRRMECIEEACHSEGHVFRSGMIKCALWMHLMDIADMYIRSFGHSQQTNHRKELFVAFMDMLPHHASREHSTTFYAATLCVTPQYLNRIVREHTGKTVREWVYSTLVGEITRRLEDSNDTMQRIASDFCFPDQAALSKFFRRQTGYSLTEYRRGLAVK